MSFYQFNQQLLADISNNSNVTVVAPVYWNEFCGNATQYDSFWDNALSVQTTLPDFTDCFQKSVLTWIPCIFLWVSSLIYVPYLWCRLKAYPGFHVTRLTILKVAVGLLLAIISLCDLVWSAAVTEVNAELYDAQPVDFVDSTVRIVTFVLSSVLTYWTFRKRIHSSGILFIFWLLEVIVSIIMFRSLIIRGTPSPMFTYVTFMIRFSLVLVAFFCCLVADISPLRQQYDGDNGFGEKTDGKPCPKLTATFPSVLFFWWFTPTIITGWRRALTNDDIWAIRKEDSSQSIVPVFERNWELEKQKFLTKHSTSTTKRASSVSKEGVNGAVTWNKYGKVPDTKRREDEAVTVAFIDGSAPASSSKEKPQKQKQPSLKMALMKTFAAYFSIGGLLILFYDCLAFINPFLLYLLLDFVKARSPYTWQGFLYAFGMFSSSLCSVLCMHHHFNIAYTTGLRIRTALTAAIYRKALTISSASRRGATVGEIVNLMSVDTQKVQDMCAFANYIWSAPLIVIGAIYFLWQILGPSTLAGVGFMIVVLPINSMILAKKIREFQRTQMGLKDSRLKLMNQILSGIKLLKLYAWETYFMNKILGIRGEELKVLRKGSIMNAVTYIMWFCSSFIVALLCFATFVLSSPTNILDAQTAFVSLSLINLLNFPMTVLPASIMFLVQALVSIGRIEDFLLKEDIDEDNVRHNPDSLNAVSVINGSFSWGEEELTVLKNIDLTVPHGRLTAVVGQVGCGKSSLLSALLGEMLKLDGSVNVNGKVAYASQQAWIQNMSLRDNILFSKPYDEDRYNKVLDACALRTDIAILPAGDNTEIGERGINLSGGQKQRVSLARAVYQNADIYLLDDTLSAVDAHVGKHIFREVIGPEGLLRNKTRILVTHGIGFLPRTDEIVVIKNGEISEKGAYQELLGHNGPFAEFIHTFLMEAESNNEELDDEEDKEQVIELQRQLSNLSPSAENNAIANNLRSSTTSLASSGGSPSKLRRRSHRSLSKMSINDDDGKEKTKQALTHKLIEEEVAEEGAVKLSVIKNYLTAATALFPTTAFVSFIAFVVAVVCTNIWLSKWTNQPVYNGTVDRDQTNMYLGVYGALGVAQTIGVFGLALSISLGSMVASRNLHTSLLSNVLRCPMSFFDTTPLGRVVNRFSKDIDILDSNIPQFTQNLLLTFAPLCSTIIVISYSTPIFIAVIIPLMIIFVFIQRVYVACARQIKRIDSVRRSPMYAFFSETLNGTSSIRAYNEQQRFIAHSDFLLDNSQRVWFEAFSSNRWIGIWAEFIGDLIILFTAIFVVLGKDTLDPGLVGLSLSFALQVNMNIIMTVRSSCELETYIIAVERIKEYSELPSEASWTNADYPVPRDWPTHGVIEFKEYNTRYRPGLDLVLKDLSCRIEAGQKVGIVGRTGAGKSSMTLALFRIIEAADPEGGTIEIDGCNLGKLGLHDVRKNLTVIAQDPVLFSGTLRFNIDPSESFTDEEVWRALEHSHLKSFVETLPDKIHHECGEDGKNLSVGQRQLVCLARALLRKSNILVLDEATAAVDLETDDLIQTTIRSEFASCTVLTIAHRLNTIMDYDRVMVLQAGKCIEFDSPSKLLANPQSSFYSMAKDAGLV